MPAEIIGAPPPFDEYDFKFDPDPAPFILLVVIGFLVGGAGHLYRSKFLVATGIAMIMAAVLGIPLVLYLAG